MFEYLPFYDEKATDEEAINILIKFVNTVYDIADKYGIDSSNAFSVILGCCEKIEALLEEKQTDIWPDGEKEPIDKFQDLIQLLGYALSDKRYLFRDPNLKEIINTIPKIMWKDIEERFTRIATAFVNRSIAYRQLIKIRRQLKYQSKRGNVYDTESDEKLDEKYKSMLLVLANNYALHKFFTRKQKTVLLNNCINNRLLIKVAPLYFLFAKMAETDSESDDYYYRFEDFISSLKWDTNLFGKQTSPSDRRKAVLICQAFDEISSDCHRLMLNRSWIMSHIFNSYEIVETIARKNRINISDEDKVKIETAVKRTFVSPIDSSALQSIGPVVEGERLGTIIYYFLIVFDSYSYQYGNIKHSRAKGLNMALKYIYNNELVEPIMNIPYRKNYSDMEYAEILRQVVQTYFLDYSFLSEELFWLITGYIPPWNYTYLNREESLYALIDEYLMDFYLETKKLLWPDGKDRFHPFRFNVELNNNIANVKTEFFIKTMNDTENIGYATGFISKIYDLYQTYLIPEVIRKRMIKYCIELYDKTRTNKTKYKSRNYAEDVYADAIMNVLIGQAFVYLRQRLFTLFASFNKYVWPMDFKDNEKKKEGGENSLESTPDD